MTEPCACACASQPLITTLATPTALRKNICKVKAPLYLINNLQITIIVWQKVRGRMGLALLACGEPESVAGHTGV